MAKKAAQQASDAASGAVDPDIAALSYEDGIAEVERLVEGIESNDIGLEASLAAYRRGQQLVQHCRGLLDKAELSVKQLSLSDAEQGG